MAIKSSDKNDNNLIPFSNTMDLVIIMKLNGKNLPFTFVFE
jgi:hypothetical protein